MSEKEKERKAFKDWFDRSAAKRLAAQLTEVMPAFDAGRFVRLATRNLKQIEFAGRVRQFSDSLRKTLPESVPTALKILRECQPELLSDSESVTDGWLQWPVGQFIADHGLAHFDESMATMIELTQRFSSEFAVRPFVDQRSDETFARLMELTDHPSEHVRRWCSEGVRSRLPWGMKLRALVADPTPIWPILEKLKDDPEIYVRRSVANNLNDIAKDHPDLVVARCRKWKQKPNANRDWLIRHALRSLIKDGHSGALELVGFGPPKKLSARLSIKPSKIRVGEHVLLEADVSSSAGKSQRLAIDYAVHFVRKAGSTTAKVFKWTTLELPGRGSVSLSKKHPMRITTIRALYPGLHQVEIQINGKRFAAGSFELEL